MAEEKSGIFRQKTVDAMQSPEVLDSYLRVTSPGIWFFLAAVICLLAGILIWGSLGTIQSTADVVVVAENGVQECIVPYANYAEVLAAGEVQVNGCTYALDAAHCAQGILDDSTDPRILLEGGMRQGDYVVAIPVIGEVTQSGVYAASVVTETIRPISLLFQ